jgi:hypothetical protein
VRDLEHFPYLDHGGACFDIAGRLNVATRTPYFSAMVESVSPL